MPYSEHAEANVNGTLELLRVASYRQATFHYVSSLAVISQADRSAVPGGRVAEELTPLPSLLRMSANTAAAARGGCTFTFTLPATPPRSSLSPLSLPAFLVIPTLMFISSHLTSPH